MRIQYVKNKNHYINSRYNNHYTNSPELGTKPELKAVKPELSNNHFECPHE